MPCGCWSRFPARYTPFPLPPPPPMLLTFGNNKARGFVAGRCRDFGMRMMLMLMMVVM
ncbi:hypothetical protein GGF41_004715 [Coemansia sp. RSA 2531]|nr:hypothetical protein GGF41_004715 [Coemansia sp. RSA 2531]